MARLSCVELRVHLCDVAVKDTQRCLKCSAPCEAGKEYRERFMGYRNNETASREFQAKQKYIGALVEAYKNYMIDGVYMSSLIPRLRNYGIKKVKTLQAEWDKNRPLMVAWCEDHGEEFPTVNVQKLIRGRTDLEHRLELHRTRLNEYKLMTQAGYTHAEIADYYGISVNAFNKRIQTSRKALEAEAEQEKLRSTAF